MKEFLSRAGRPFIVKVVDEDHHAYAELIALGYRTVPVTVIGAHVIQGFDPAALTRALEDAG